MDDHSDPIHRLTFDASLFLHSAAGRDRVPDRTDIMEADRIYIEPRSRAEYLGREDRFNTRGKPASKPAGVTKRVHVNQDNAELVRGASHEADGRVKVQPSHIRRRDAFQVCLNGQSRNPAKLPPHVPVGLSARAGPMCMSDGCCCPLGAALQARRSSASHELATTLVGKPMGGIM
jgi:hypothetical protein